MHSSSARDQLVCADRGFIPPYDISYRGLKLPRVSAAFGRFELRREADLPQVGTELKGRRIYRAAISAGSGST